MRSHLCPLSVHKELIGDAKHTLEVMVGKRLNTVMPVPAPQAVTARTLRNRRRRQRQRSRGAGALNTVRSELRAEKDVAAEFAGLSLRGERSRHKHRGEGLGKIIGERFAEVDLNATNTVAGAAWLSKFLDPCHTTMEVQGIPDAVTSVVVTPHYESVSTVEMGTNPPAGYQVGSGTWQPTADWNLVEISDFSTGMVYTLKYQGTLTSTLTDYIGYATMARMSGIDTLFTGSEITSSRPMFGSVTYEFTGPALADQGRSVAAQLTPDWKEFRDIVVDDIMSEKLFYWQFNEQGYAADVPGFQVWLSSLVQADQKALSGAAKEGAYFPISNNNPFRLKKHDFPLAVTDDDLNVFIQNPFVSNFETPTPGVVNALTSPFADYWDMNASVYWVTGLSSQSSFQRTTRWGLECTISSSSSLRPFSHPSPMFDRVAMESATDIRTMLDSAYPSSYNFLDKLWGTIKKVAKPLLGIGKIAKPFLDIALPGSGIITGPALDLADKLIR